MKFQCTVDINAPIGLVVDRLQNMDNLKEWQDGFVGWEHVNGVPGEVGSQTNLRYKMGKREMDLLETIQVNDLPREYTALYEHKDMSNTMSIRLEELENGVTRYISDFDYIQFNGFIPRLIARFFPSVFRKPTQKWLNQFKAFVERSV